ncbi:M48 family metallopeptidase [Leptolyngbya cf. ectocarpi LEGE 11479]|uniref:M48 family metallopeptidase n=1 Tax=Leptolyngbya cf. ectocarpi LEGE 11479 TaxID=1828722 RepID=A0A928ZZY4_LEPEC|nr:M48 family metallopeptidase [Leptolyngbya ectocarpi]MBE9070622.1 M48 family metallopeptidase [Leptolyngbya cf. ectocarpi LEGE 11479]
MKYTPREIVHEVNITPVHPLVNFGYLIGTVVAAGVAIYASLGVIGAQIAARIGPETEAKIGEVLFERLFVGTSVIEEGAQYDYTRSLAESLLSDDLKQRPKLQVHILDEPIPNAMVIPGGHVFVTTGLLADIETENELAFVLAHELGHFDNRDTLRGLGRSLVFLSLHSLLGLSGVQLPPMLTGSVNLADLHYSRDQEQRADVYAFEIMYERYGHVDHALDFFERLNEQELDLGVADRLLEWQSTHPLTESRIDYLEALATERGWALEGEATALPNQ